MATLPRIDWLEPSRLDNGGVDHLGMRVAGETAIARLIDFTTTVSPRVRYLSFLCWSARRAFEAAQTGRARQGQFQVDLTRWRAAIKRDDFLLASATLLAQPGATGVAGSLALGRVVRAAEELGRLTVEVNHLRASAGSFAIYAGSMRQLGLLLNSRGLDVLSPSGNSLADAFDEALAETGQLQELEEASPSVEALRQIGETCGLAQLNEAASQSDRVRTERDLLRSLIVDWDAFRRGDPRCIARIHSLGVVIRLHQLSAEAPTLLQFREATLLGGLRSEDGFHSLALPKPYVDCLAQWKVYQAHALATYALENLLSLALYSEEAAIGLESLEDKLVSLLAEDREPLDDMPEELGAWTQRPWAKVEQTIEELQEDPSGFSEIDLMVSLGDWDSSDGLIPWAQDAFLMLLFTLTRLRTHLAAEPTAWLGDRSRERLAPHRLIEIGVVAREKGLTCSEFFREVLRENVLLQHQRNALRKLLGDPSKYTALFTLEGRTFIPLGTHEPDTSNPRFANAVRYLIDLGYLAEEEPHKPTTDGRELLKAIASGGRR